MTDTEVTLAGVWAEVLGVANVGLDDDFFAMGGDSLAAVTLVELVADEFNVPLPHTLLLELTTVRRLAAHIDESAGSPRGRDPDRDRGGSAIAPLFTVHDEFSGLFWGRHLSDHLGDSQPVCMLKPPHDLAERLANGFDLVELAAYHLEQIRRVRRTGPYRLYGYCFGGVVAFEIALQLQRLGEVVDLIAIGDAAAPAINRAAAATAHPDLMLLDEVPAAFARRSWEHLLSLRRLSLVDATRAVSRDARRVVPLIRWRFSTRERRRRAEAWRRQAVGRQLVTLLRGYVPTARFEGSLLLIETLEDRISHWGLPPAENKGWNDDVTGEVMCALVRCAHADLGEEPFIGQVADILRDALGRLSPARGELEAVQPGVEPALRQQFLVRPPLDDSPVIEHED
jgi:thioesterase domain-containing protein/acyl carrier protein